MSMAIESIEAHSAAVDTYTTTRPRGVSVLVAIFIIGLVTPLIVDLGSLKLTVYRVVLLVLFFPALHRLFTGRAGRLRFPDFCVIGICVWSSISFSVVHGLGQMVETIGILWVETLGAYLIGRCYIRTPAAFHTMVRMLFWLAVVLLPFALYEAITGEAILITLFSNIGSTYPDHWMPGRMNLDRVQGPFPHPIHFGVFILSLVGVSYYVLGYHQKWIMRVLRVPVIAFTGALSLSSGPLVALMAQLNIMIWDGVMNSVRQRWYILAGLSALGFLVIDLISNRTPFHVIASYLAFNSNTAYSRINIWIWGTKNILDNPVFGIGFNDWERMPWMTASVDMFWIAPAMQNGILVGILWLALFSSIFLPIAYRHDLGERVNWYRTGYLVTMFGLFMVGWTVHFWTNTYVFFVFMLASGVWLLDYEESAGSLEATQASDLDGPAYSRFAPRELKDLNGVQHSEPRFVRGNRKVHPGREISHE